jgi:alkylated DNA repair dioxygenase AlkB
MELFSINPETNILYADGEVFYHGKILEDRQADVYFESLLDTVQWKNDEAIVFGKHIITKRKAAWYGDEAYSYTYSNTTKTALEWTKDLLEIKQSVETICRQKFNSCLLNLYHSGEEGMSWHSDDEKALGRNTCIASVSFGSKRRFMFRHKVEKRTVALELEHGSLLVMKGTTQRYWLHSLPKAKRVHTPRVNLTFRNIVQL